MYLVVKQSPMYRQMSFQEFLFGPETTDDVISYNQSNTRTYVFDRMSDRMMAGVRKLGIDVPAIIGKLNDFNNSTNSLREADRSSLYRTFYIPKKSHGFRRIDAPKPELYHALSILKTIFEEDCKILHHTSAFAYVRKRSFIDALKRHQANESKWFAKYDIHDFFGSTTEDFVLNMFEQIYPFSAIMAIPEGREELVKAIGLAFFNGGLPQGTPISPLITNTMMIPVDYCLSNKLRDFRCGHDTIKCVYTRYADDFTISSKHNFDYKAIENFIKEVLSSFGATFSINEEKTRYGSSAGANWNFGLMLNAENKITIGHKRKKQFQAMITSYVLDKKNGNPWGKNDIQVLEGYRNYYRQVEPESINGIMAHLSDKFGLDIVRSIKEDLR